MGDQNGLRWIDLTQDKPRLAGPFAKIRITGDLEFAADLNRLFFEVDDDDIAYLDVRSTSAPVRLGRMSRAADLVYEPVRRELYVFSGTEQVAVFDAASGAVLGHAVTTNPSAIAYDAAAGLLVATSLENSGRKGIETYRLDASGLVRVDRTSWVDPGMNSLEPIPNGFIQLGSVSSGEEPARFHNTALLIWRAKAP